MKKIIITISIFTIAFNTQAQTLKDAWHQAKDEVKKDEKAVVDKAKESTGLGNSTPALTQEEVVKGLREALTVGTNNSTAFASKLDGYYKNPRLFIPWPPEAQAMRDKLMKMGFQKKIEEFETSLNRAAEEAAKNAAPIFVNAITNMSIGDGFAILKGEDTAATNYLRKTTYSPLIDKFMPVVKDAIAKVKVTSYWNPLVTAYNKLPGVKKQNPDLNDYVCKRGANGLFVLIADEETKIRKDPMARVTDILKKVFGNNK
jgi:hypothetical protein